MEFNYLLTTCPAEINAVIQNKTLSLAEKIEKHIEYLEKNPHCWEVMNSLGIAAFSQGDQDWALHIFEMALSLVPNEFTLIYNKLTIQIQSQPARVLHDFVALFNTLQSHLTETPLEKPTHPTLCDLEFKILCCLVYAQYPNPLEDSNPIIRHIAKRYAYLFQSYDIVFYCGGYNHYFNIKPIIESILHQPLCFKIVLLKTDNPNLRQYYQQLEQQYPSNVLIIESIHEIFLFQAKLCITATTPTFFNYGKPYSYQVIYVPHSISGIKGIYSLDSFLSCDFVLTSSEIQVSEFVELKQAGLFHGQTYPLGYPKLNVLKNQLATLPPTQPDAVIVAPFFTNEHNQDIVILPQYGQAITQAILSLNLKAIIRPHPTSYNGENVFGRAEDLAIIEKLRQQFADHPHFMLDQNPLDYLENYAKSLIMITDFSGTALTYALLLERPVIFFRIPNQETHYAQLSATNFQLQSEYGMIVYSIDALKLAIIEICQNYAFYQEKVRRFKQKFLFHANDDIEQVFYDFLKPFFPALS